MEPPELTAGPVRLRPWRDDDVDALFAAQRDPVSRLWSGSGGVHTRADAVALLDLLRTQADRASWAVVDGGTGELVGSVSVHSIDPRQGAAQIGYWTAPGVRGRGVAPTAVDAACRWVFGALEVERIELCHAVENTASGRVAEKAGFTREGRLRRSFRYGDGVKHDELLWSRLSDDPDPVLAGR